MKLKDNKARSKLKAMLRNIDEGNRNTKVTLQFRQYRLCEGGIVYIAVTAIWFLTF